MENIMICEEKSMVVAYLDLLGFCTWIEKDILGACQLVYNYHQVVREKIKDTQNDPANKHYDARVKRLLEQNAIDSFDYFLPFSDSILIASSAADRFIGQLSSFLIGSYLLTAQLNIRNDRTSDPTLGTAKIFSASSLKLIEEKKEYWFPVIFRGGISCGGISIIECSSIIHHTPSKATQITGKPVIKAVALEKNSGKGPRIFCESEFLSILGLDLQAKFRNIEGKNLYELLWPAFKYQNPSDTINGALEFCALFEPAASLWRHFKDDPKVEPHYFEFLKLIIRSTLHVFGNDKKMRNEIEHEIGEFGLGHKKSDILRACLKNEL